MPFTPFSENRPPFFSNIPQKSSAGDLPRFIKPLPAKIGPEEISYLEKKGALTVPKGILRSEMLRAYVEFVHPYMPLLDLHDFLTVIDKPDGSNGKVSLILFQAVMFAGSAFVDMDHLRTAGYATRKEARKDFFQKTRVSHRPFPSTSVDVCFGRVGHCCAPGPGPDPPTSDSRCVSGHVKERGDIFPASGVSDIADTMNRSSTTLITSPTASRLSKLYCY